jgi:phenylacetate-CoA ligase
MSPLLDQAKRFYEALLDTERLPADTLRRYQGRLLSLLVAHARSTTDHYAGVPLPERVDNPSQDAWLSVPTLTKAEVVAEGERLRARSLPPGHGALRVVESGGSTGRPLQVVVSDLDSDAHVLATYRMFTAYGFDQSRPLFMIRPPHFGFGRDDHQVFRKWGFAWSPEAGLGDRISLPLTVPTTEQLARLKASEPAYVNTLPSNLLRLVLAAESGGERPRIPAIVAVGEYLPPETAAAAEALFGSRVINLLSSAEGGIIAVACPEEGRLHVQSEIVLAEILKEDGRPCAPGEVGEVVVTPFYTYSTPLLRYRSGDFVECGGPCSCGRTSPTIGRFVGRRQHMFSFPDGRRELPPIDRVALSRLVGNDRWQLAQTGPARAEFRCEPAEALEAHRSEILGQIDAALRGRFDLSVVAMADVPVASSGKRHHAVNLWNDAA